MNKTRVFVYGSLKQSQCNGVALEGGTLLGRCFLEGPYAMIDLGWYPGVCDMWQVDESTVGSTRIYGEVYEIDEEVLLTLDMIEGHPDYYKRVKVETPFKKAWCYFLPYEYALAEDAKHIPEGIWKATEEEREFARGG